MRRRILFLTIAFITFIIQIMIVHYVFLPDSMEKVTILDEGWDVNYNDTYFHDIRLSELRKLIGNSTNKGDTIILSRDMKEINNYQTPTLLFESRFSAYRVLVGDRIIEEKFEDLLKDNKFVGCDNNFIQMPTGVESSIIRIELHVAEDDAYNYFEAPIFGSYMDVLHYTIFSNLFVIITSVFLIIFGLLFFAIAVAFRSTVPEIDMQSYSSLLFITFGIWFLSQFKLLDFIIDTGDHQTEIEYISLYITVPFMYMVMGSMQNYLHSKLFWGFALTGSIVIMIPIMSHFSGWLHINRFLGLYQLDAMVFFIFMLIMLFRDIKRKRITRYQTIQLVGITMLAIAFLFNVLFYLLEVAGISEQIMLSKKAVPYGVLAMVFANLVNYYIYIAQSFARKKEYSSLTHLAYADGLTDLANRSRYEKYIDGLYKKGDDFCLISIDLNGLKVINDNAGHLMGDKYIREFGQVLTECMEGKCFAARIGGDEFVVVLTGDELFSAEQFIREMNEKLERMNATDHSMIRSAATGYAFRSEVEGNGHEVYLLADERMYNNKRQMHKELKMPER